MSDFFTIQNWPQLFLLAVGLFFMARAALKGIRRRFRLMLRDRRCGAPDPSKVAAYEPPSGSAPITKGRNDA